MRSFQICRGNPSVAKVGGLQSQGVKGEALAALPRSLDNDESVFLRLSRTGKMQAQVIDEKMVPKERKKDFETTEMGSGLDL